MLSPADADLARRDTGIPALGRVLDAQAMGQMLARRRPASAGRLVLVKQHVRYKPGMNCLVVYRGRLDNREFLCYAKAHGSDAGVKLQKALERKAAPGPLGPGRIVLEGDGLVISFFPNDSKLRGLRKALAPDSWSGLLGGAGSPGRSLAVTPLAYKPERRFVGRLDSAEGPLAVLKVYKPSSYTAAVGKANLADRLPFLPSLLARDDERQCIALHWEPGLTLVDLLRRGMAADAHLQDAGRSLARFHGSTPTGRLAIRRVDSELSALRELFAGVAWLIPAEKTRTDRLWEGVARRLHELPSVVSPIHGDFYANQVLLTDRGVRLLDFDELCLGQPAADLGLFIAHLECEALYGRLRPDQARAFAAALLLGYRQAGGEVCNQAVALYGAIGLLQLVHRPFRDCLIDWPSRTEAWLARCETLLAAAAPRPAAAGRAVVGPSTSVEKTADPLGSLLVEALDPGHARVRLAAAMQCRSETPSLEVRAIKLRRHKPGRRALIEYRLAAAAGEHYSVLGKIRSRGLDVRTWRLMQELHGNRLNRYGRYQVEVPAPLGVVPAWHMWLQANVPGKTAWAGLQGASAVSVAKGIAEALYALHVSGTLPDRQHGADEELGILNGRLSRVAQAHSEWADRISRVRDSCGELLQTLRHRRTTAIHRDFYPDQVLVTDDRLYLLDLDLCSLGDPALDVGNFIAHLQEQDLRRHANPWYRLEVQAAFVRRYGELSADKDLPEAAGVYAVLTLARHIHLSTQFPDRASYTNRILALCESRLGLVPNRGCRKDETPSVMRLTAP